MTTVPLEETSPNIPRLSTVPFVGKTLLGPSSYEGSDAGIFKPRPLETPYAGLYSSGAAGKTHSFDVSFKVGQDHLYLSKRVGVPKIVCKKQKRGGKYCNVYHYKNGTIIFRYLKNPPKANKQVSQEDSDKMNGQDFMEIMNEFNTDMECKLNVPPPQNNLPSTCNDAFTPCLSCTKST
jgi:hypothetical protein